MTQEQKEKYALSFPSDMLVKMEAMHVVEEAIIMMGWETPDGEPFNTENLNHMVDFALSWQAYQRAVYAEKLNQYLN